MILTESARSGQLIVKKNGRYLASTFDPVKEAVSWANKALESASARDAIIVLGLGAGYHVVELMNRRPVQLITVIECDHAVADAALKIHPQLSPCGGGDTAASARIVTEGDWTKLTEHGTVRDALGGCYSLALHMPSIQTEPEFYARAEKLLIGRDKTSFLLQLRARPELFALLDQDAIAQLGDEVISIKTLQKLFAPQASGAYERRVWKALEELIT